jgi:hypothetical protein
MTRSPVTDTDRDDELSRGQPIAEERLVRQLNRPPPRRPTRVYLQTE